MHSWRIVWLLVAGLFSLFAGLCWAVRLSPSPSGGADIPTIQPPKRSDSGMAFRALEGGFEPSSQPTRVGVCRTVCISARVELSGQCLGAALSVQDIYNTADSACTGKVDASKIASKTPQAVFSAQASANQWRSIRSKVFGVAFNFFVPAQDGGPLTPLTPLSTGSTPGFGTETGFFSDSFLMFDDVPGWRAYPSGMSERSDRLLR